MGVGATGEKTPFSIRLYSPIFTQKKGFMGREAAFREEIEKGYAFKGESITLGAAMLDGQAVTGAHVKVPLKDRKSVV